MGAHPGEFAVKELSFIDPHDLGSRIELREHVIRPFDNLTGNPQLRVRNDIVIRVAVIELRLEDLDPLSSNRRTPEQSNQLFRLA